MAQDKAYQKLQIRTRIEAIKKASRELSDAVAALDHGFIVGIIPDSFYVRPSELSDMQQLARAAMFSLPIRAIFAPILYSATIVEEGATYLLFDLSPGGSVPDNINLQRVNNRAKIERLVRENRFRRKV